MSEYQFSTDGTGTGAGAWADEQTDAHKFIRFRIKDGPEWGEPVGVELAKKTKKKTYIQKMYMKKPLPK